MTQPHAKIHHRTAFKGHFVLQPGKSDWQTMNLPVPDPHLAFRNHKGKLQAAIDFVDEQLAFWAVTQFHDVDPEMVAGNRILFKAMRYWPQER